MARVTVTVPLTLMLMQWRPLVSAFGPTPKVLPPDYLYVLLSSKAWNLTLTLTGRLPGLEQ